MSVAHTAFAFDKQSARTYDAEGRMRVRDCVISVAEINPYYGREIPGWERLGLDPEAVYDMYRDPAELATAADSFNGMSLMVRHVAQTATTPQKEYIGGSVYNPRFNPETGQLRADLFVFDAQAIAYVDSGELADLSSSYRYTPDMTPIEVGGRKAHGTMRNIQANHVALVKDGRATGAHVADSALNPQTGANPVADPTNPTNPETPAGPVAGAEGAQALMLILQKIEGLEGRLATLEGGPANAPAAALSVDPPVAVAADGEDEDEDKPAMDAAAVQALIETAVKGERERAAAVADAKLATRRVLGDTIAMDNAGDIYRAALKQIGVEVSTVAAGHERTAWEVYNAAATATAVSVANDSRLTPGNPQAAPFDGALARIRLAGR